MFSPGMNPQLCFHDKDTFKIISAPACSVTDTVLK